ncbi:cyclohexanone 1,2-monooxygenase [Lophium mytilinum]|uniref:Cyclohexanone 1,2-monooxygenase n=1 Tax=Lophium mytilinum TaxID=390894 RepID=A0A6A6R8J8_9PEZI|nr:cyclohexanone 1,2-monooxygenase [Lophium mytilinum]
MSFDTEVLIIGGGMSGLGLAVQLIKKYGVRDFEIIEKSDDVGGTWLANTYPGCGCDVASHFYSYSFALNPDWTRKYSMRPEIQQYFRSVAEQYKILENVRFQSFVEKAIWDELSETWVVTIKDQKTKERITRRAKIVISAVGALSVPKECDTPGAESFEGPIFHSAKWDHSFDWQNKDVVVIGNGCSATQFVPIMSGGPKATKQLTQFARQSHWLSERENPYYSSTFKKLMRYVPLAMRLYRAKLYWDMEKDFAGFNIQSGRNIRADLVKTNQEYVKRVAPKKYWDVLIPKTEIGCKRKVLDTDYLACLHRPNVELVATDPIDEITPSGVRTKSGREVKADAIVLAIGFATSQLLFPMDIRGKNGISLNKHWDSESQGVAQAYFGTCVPGFPNFFIMMGPNTTTGHLSVIYTVECQINFTLSLIEPIIKTLPSYRSRSILPSLLLFNPVPSVVEVKPEAARLDSAWTQLECKKLVWSSGCTNWAMDPKTGMNIMMYPDWQFLYWWRSIFYKKQDFVYTEAKSGKEVKPWSPSPLGLVARVAAVGLLVSSGLFAAGVLDRDAVEDGAKHLIASAKELVKWR